MSGIVKIGDILNKLLYTPYVKSARSVSKRRASQLYDYSFLLFRYDIMIPLFCNIYGYAQLRTQNYFL